MHIYIYIYENVIFALPQIGTSRAYHCTDLANAMNLTRVGYVFIGKCFRLL